MRSIKGQRGSISFPANEFTGLQRGYIVDFLFFFFLEPEIGWGTSIVQLVDFYGLLIDVENLDVWFRSMKNFAPIQFNHFTGWFSCQSCDWPIFDSNMYSFNKVSISKWLIIRNWLTIIYVDTRNFTNVGYKYDLETE